MHRIRPSFTFVLFGGKVRGINKRGGLYFVISFLQNGQFSFFFSQNIFLKERICNLWEEILSFKCSVYCEKVSISWNPLPVSSSKLPYISVVSIQIKRVVYTERNFQRKIKYISFSFV